MKFFIDTANVEEIKKGLEMGLVDGVTTNPTLLAREKRNPEETIREILSLVPGPVNLEVLSTQGKEMVGEAGRLASLGDQVVVKIPMTEEGMKAVKILSAQKIRTNVTLVFQPLQALIAAKAGAGYVSPFVGRLDDISAPGMEVVEQIVAIYTNYGFETEVIVASVRNPLHVLHAAMMGADIATIPFTVLTQLMSHPLTDRGIERFLKDYGTLKE
ncbi:MAG: fructose-6-phosphate aldolase [Syntrophorhabdales bacterium]|jgi:transaldolase